MNKIDVLLLNLPTGTWYKKKLAEGNSMPPLGIMYIGTYLKKNNYTVKIIDLAVENLDENQFFQAIEECNPSIIGMSTYNEAWNVQKILCRRIKQKYPNIIIAAGGAFATFCYEQVLNESMTDFVLRGEGEYVFCQLCDCLLRGKLKKENIKGLCYKNKEGSVIANANVERIKNLDQLPFPDRSLIKKEKYVLPYTISTSRGCPGQCIFCSSKSFWGKSVIMRSAENVYKEVMDIYEKCDTIEETLKKAKLLQDKFGSNILFAINTPYPGTELRKNLEEYEAELIVPDNSKLRVDRPGMKIKHVEVNKIRQYYDIAERMFKKNN